MVTEKMDGSIKADNHVLELEMLHEVLLKIKTESTLLIQLLPRIRDDAEKILRNKVCITD